VLFLERVLKEPAIELKRPKYLNDAALESSQAAVEVVRNESVRLYELSLKVIANGLGWRKPDLLDKDALHDPHRIRLPADSKSIDQAYDIRIKHIYSAIVEFVIRAREKLTGPFAENLQVYSRAVRDLAAAIKGVKHLQKNLLKYIGSNNPAIAYAYNELRVIVATVVHQVEEARTMDDLADASLNLDHALLRIEQDSLTSGSRIESLIREHSITPEMATSLMTDTEYTLEICRNLVNMAKLMFTDQEFSALYMDSGVELDKDDMTDILQQ
jgi:phosphate:Na+ symporter